MRARVEDEGFPPPRLSELLFFVRQRLEFAVISYNPASQNVIYKLAGR